MLFDIITVVELLFDGQPYIISYFGSDWTHTHTDFLDSSNFKITDSYAYNYIAT